jgi:hypothetical protein
MRSDEELAGLPTPRCPSGRSSYGSGCRRRRPADDTRVGRGPTGRRLLRKREWVRPLRTSLGFARNPEPTSSIWTCDVRDPGRLRGAAIGPRLRGHTAASNGVHPRGRRDRGTASCATRKGRVAAARARERRRARRAHAPPGGCGPMTICASNGLLLVLRLRSASATRGPAGLRPPRAEVHEQSWAQELDHRWPGVSCLDQLGGSVAQLRHGLAGGSAPVRERASGANPDPTTGGPGCWTRSCAEAHARAEA